MCLIADSDRLCRLYGTNSLQSCPCLFVYVDLHLQTVSSSNVSSVPLVVAEVGACGVQNGLVCSCVASVTTAVA